MQLKNCTKNILKISTLLVLIFFFFFCFGKNISKTSNIFSMSKCDDLEIIYARGSGQEKNDEGDYQIFRSELENLIKNTNLSYSFYEPDYPAVPVNISPEGLKNLLGAIVSGGESYTYGESILEGVKNLKNHISAVSESCPNTKFVLSGYSQGAQLISKSLDSLDAEKIIYVATFGDPKTYLPEGAGLFPDACRGKNLSPYRAYVPNCTAEKGILGSFEPYRNELFMHKSGLWCNKNDIMCSRILNFAAHTAYAQDGLYADAAIVIANRIFAEFPNLEREKPKIARDTVIMLDTTASMYPYISEYKAELLRLLEESLKTNGRVAVYTFGDKINNGVEPTELCGFSTCTADIVSEKLENIHTSGGGDAPESVFYSSLNVMKKLSWRSGATKSYIVLTDAPALAEDFGGVTEKDVVEMSLKIDPVNFYVISKEENRPDYQTFVHSTNGGFYTLADKMSLSETILVRPSVNFPKENYEVYTGSTLTFNAKVLSNDPIVSYEWDLDFDGIYETLTASPSASKTYESDGSGYIQLRVTDSLGNISTGSASVEIVFSDKESLSSLSSLEQKTDTEEYEVSWSLSNDSDVPDYYLVILNETLLGITIDNSLKITEINEEKSNTLSITPVKNNTRGDSKTILLKSPKSPDQDSGQNPIQNLEPEKIPEEPISSDFRGRKILVPDCGKPKFF